MIDTTDEWIVERTGIRERHVGGTTAALSIESGRQALEHVRASTRRRSTASCSPRPRPTARCRRRRPTVQHELGLRCGAFDVNAACSGFTYALVVAHGLIAIGAQQDPGASAPTRCSRITDWTDRNTAILFADGSGAVVLEAVEGRGQLLGWDLDADGSLPTLPRTAEVGGYIQMDGKEVFRRAVRIMVDSAEKSMKHAGVTADDIALVVPHQANIRIIEAACDRLGIADGAGRHACSTTPATRRRRRSRSRWPTPSTTAASQDGDLVLLVGFGAGMTAASAVLRWGGTTE